MKIKAIFGLGNPGEKYKGTYHNVGAIFVERTFGSLGEEKIRGAGLDCRIAEISGREIIIMSPNPERTYMNATGDYVKGTLRHFKLKPEEILIIHDDSDIALGKYKYAFASRSAGHKGVQSIIDALQTNSFHRIKIGIRAKPGKALDFVLKKISKKDKETLDSVFNEIELYLAKNIE